MKLSVLMSHIFMRNYTSYYYSTQQSLTLSQTTNFTSILKEFADNNFKFNENDRKFSNRVENIVGKEEIAG